jgi:hypothetical protein
MSDWVIESIQEIVSKMNEAERVLFLFVMFSWRTGGTEHDL